MTLQERHNQILERCVDSLKIWKDLISEYVDDEDAEASELKKLKQITESYCDINHEFKKSVRALQEVEEQVNASEEDGTVVDIKKLYDEKIQNQADNSGEYTNTDIWQAVFEGITDVMEVKQKNKKSLKDNQYEELEDSLFCSNVFTPPVDPISKVIIREPVRSKRCKHVYEKDMIINYIKQQRRRAKCPYIGCNSNQLTMTDIVEDQQLQSQISQYLENHEDDTEEEDD